MKGNAWLKAAKCSGLALKSVLVLFYEKDCWVLLPWSKNSNFWTSWKLSGLEENGQARLKSVRKGVFSLHSINIQKLCPHWLWYQNQARLEHGKLGPYDLIGPDWNFRFRYFCSAWKPMQMEREKIRTTNQCRRKGQTIRRPIYLFQHHPQVFKTPSSVFERDLDKMMLTKLKVS